MSAGSRGSGLLDVGIGAGVDESMGMGMGIEAVKGADGLVDAWSSGRAAVKVGEAGVHRVGCRAGWFGVEDRGWWDDGVGRDGRGREVGLGHLCLGGVPGKPGMAGRVLSTRGQWQESWRSGWSPRRS